MTIGGLKEKKLFLFGGLAGIGVVWLLGIISKGLSLIPGLDVSLQAISVKTTGLAGTIGTGLGTYAQKLFGAVGLGLPEMLYAFIGGGLFVLLGAFLVDKLNIRLIKTREGHLATILVVAGIVSGWILSMTVSVPALAAIVNMAISALALSYILVFLDKQLKIGIVP